MAKTGVGTFTHFTDAMTTLADFVPSGISEDQINVMTPNAEQKFAKHPSRTCNSFLTYLKHDLGINEEPLSSCQTTNP